MLVGLVAWVPDGFGGQGCPPGTVNRCIASDVDAMSVDCLVNIIAATVVAAAGRFNLRHAKVPDASLFLVNIHSRLHRDRAQSARLRW